MKYIPFNYKEIDVLSFKSVLREGKELKLIEEELGSFKNQDNVAKHITNEFLELFKSGFSDKKVNIDIDNETVELTLKIIINNFLIQPKADIIPYGKEDNGEIILEGFNVTLFLRKTDIEKLDDEEIFNKISTIISHECGHGNIFQKRMLNKQTIEVADWYGKIHRILDNDNISHIVNLFAYAIYACYYQEKQAIVSSTHSQLIEKYPNKRLKTINIKLRELLSIEEKYNYLLKLYKKDLVNTEAYQIYYTILYKLLPQLNENNKQEIINVFSNYGISLNIDKELKKIERLANEALCDVTRNSTIFFYEFLLKKCNIKS